VPIKVKKSKKHRDKKEKKDKKSDGKTDGKTDKVVEKGKEKDIDSEANLLLNVKTTWLKYNSKVLEKTDGKKDSKKVAPTLEVNGQEFNLVTDPNHSEADTTIGGSDDDDEFSESDGSSKSSKKLDKSSKNFESEIKKN